MAKQGIKDADNIVRQTMFNVGEVDEQVWKRTDAAKLYLSAAQALTNCEVGTTGLVKKRRGSRFMFNGNGYITPQSRGYEFRDKNGVYYLIISAEGQWYVLDTGTEESYVITDDDDFVITIDGDYVVAFDGTMSLVQTVTGTPYLLSDLTQIDYARDDDSLVLSHPDYPPARIYISDYATDPPTFTYQVLDVNPYPVYDFGDINYAGYTATFTNPSATTFRLVLSGAAASSFTTAWIGGQVVGLGTSTINALGYGNITNVTYPAPGQVQFDGNIVVPFEAPANMPTVGSQYIVRQPAWSNDLGWPAKVAYFQNRLWFGNTARLSDTVFASKINQPVVFDVGTGRDTDAIVYTIGIEGSGALLWMNGGKQLELYCENMECACPQNENVGLTPSTFSVRQQSAYGASPNLKPIGYLNDSYFVAKTGQALVNFHFTGVGLAYESKSKSLQSQHLMKNPQNRALLRGDDSSQDNFIYFMNQSDNTFTNFQFAAEAELAALTPSTTPVDDDGNSTVDLIDIVSVNNYIFMLKYYELSNTYTIEVMSSQFKMDNFGTFDMADTGVVTGLSRFNGYQVQVLFENQDYGLYDVDSGTITVDNPDEDVGEVQIGLLYDVVIRPMYFFAGANFSPYFKHVSTIYVDYYQSLNFYIEGTLVPWQTFAEIQAGEELVPKTGTAIFNPVDGYERFATFEITQSSPFDLQILSIAYQIDATTI